MRECNLDDFNFGNLASRYALIKERDFIYAHFKVNDGNATVAGGLVDGNLYFSVSLCSPVDNFSKKRGRSIADSHMVDIDSSHKRGVLLSLGEAYEQPALILKKALGYFLSRSKRVPVWASNPTITFRTSRRADSCPAEGNPSGLFANFRG